MASTVIATFAVAVLPMTSLDRITPVERQGGTWDVFYWVEGLDALRADLVKRGAKLAYDLTLQQYGMREFAVRDLDGHVLGFGEPTA